jgi:hypothetical protein
MMKQIDYNFYTQLQERSISVNKTPKTIKNSPLFKSLLNSGIIDTRKSGRGTILFVNKHEDYGKFLKVHFPISANLTASKANNIKQLKNSKARKTVEIPVFFLRGFKTILINDNSVDLNHYTNKFGFFGLNNLRITADKICFVENKNTFLNAEKVLGTDWVYIHSYGRVGVNSLSDINSSNVLVFVDFDFNGLDEYLRIKSCLNNAVLYLPPNFMELFITYGASLKGKQKASKKVMSSQIEEIKMIRNLIETTNKFLEQEILVE